MRKRTMHLMLSFVLAIGVLAGTALTATAQDEPDVMYFPWVPNGAVIEDERGFGSSGPYDGALTIQNLEDVEITVFYRVMATGDISWRTVDPHATTTLTSDDLFDASDDVDGSGVVVWGERPEADISVPARIAGVQKQAAPEELIDDSETGGSHETVAGYTGLSQMQVDDYAVLPIAQTNSNWNTLIRVTNFDTEDAIDLTLMLNPAGGGSSPSFSVDNIGAGETATIDLLDLGLAPEWVGSAVLAVEGSDALIGAVAERVKNETSMLIMNTSQLLPVDDNEEYGPLVFSSYNFWNTGIAVASLSESGDVDVSVTYYDSEGNEVGDGDSLTLPPLGMDFIYTPAPPSEDEAGFVGSAVIEADGPITGAVDEVKYFGEDLDTGHAMSYMLEEQGADAGQSLAMPLVQRGAVDEMDVVHGDTSGIRLFNPTDEWVVFGLSYLDQDGNEVATGVQFLDAKQGRTSYTVDVDELEEGFQGSAVIQVVSGAGSVVAASNNVNYDVAFDGSASFNLIRTGEVDVELPEDEIPMLTR